MGQMKHIFIAKLCKGRHSCSLTSNVVILQNHTSVHQRKPFFPGHCNLVADNKFKQLLFNYHFNSTKKSSAQAGDEDGATIQDCICSNKANIGWISGIIAAVESNNIGLNIGNGNVVSSLVDPSRRAIAIIIFYFILLINADGLKLDLN
ncbi:hypothetical protein CDAR_597301 [Caerostris darwini]|uniref:LAGLIDADG homing endonuclease n=1 Tax=Caerostris darwini TaxID=1538125 RepID=A0AAV4U2E1_9ARAC|nr:hypothetical protein CDAR_597301 [Caerostris darwini]